MNSVPNGGRGISTGRHGRVIWTGRTDPSNSRDLTLKVAPAWSGPTCSGSPRRMECWRARPIIAAVVRISREHHYSNDRICQSEFRDLDDRDGVRSERRSLQSDLPALRSRPRERDCRVPASPLGRRRASGPGGVRPGPLDVRSIAPCTGRLSPTEITLMIRRFFTSREGTTTAEKAVRPGTRPLAPEPTRPRGPRRAAVDVARPRDDLARQHDDPQRPVRLRQRQLVQRLVGGRLDRHLHRRPTTTSAPSCSTPPATRSGRRSSSASAASTRARPRWRWTPRAISW